MLQNDRASVSPFDVINAMLLIVEFRLDLINIGMIHRKAYSLLDLGTWGS